MKQPDSFFAEHGWIILKGVLNPNEVGDLREAYDEVIGPHLDQMSETDVVQLPQPHARHPAFSKTLQHAGLWSAVRETLRWDEVQLLQDVLLHRTGPSSGRVEWHRDHTYTAFLNPPILASVRVSLTHSRETSGCLQVIDKSHLLKLSLSPDVFGSSIERGLMVSLSESGEEDIPSQIRTIELEPGDVSIHHSKTLHGSFENRTDEPQKIMVHHVLDARCKLDPVKLPNAEARAHFPTTSTGHLAPQNFPILG